MPRLLPIATLCCALIACSTRPPTRDCPPERGGPDEPAAAGAKTSGSAATPKAARQVEAEAEPLSVSADDGHELRLWSLAPLDMPADRPAIVLVHGRTWSSLPDFDLRVEGDPSLSLMHALAREGIPSYALDLRGYGGTPRDSSGWLEPDRAARDLAAALAFVEAREGEAPDLLGWSMGALVAQLCIQRHPEAARSLVLYGYPRDPDARSPELADEQHAEPARATNSAAAARSDFITPETIREEAIAAYVEASLAADPVRVDWRGAHQFNDLDPEQLSVPTLVIHGALDPIDRQLCQAKLFTRTQTPDRQWVIVPRADHAAHLEQPERFVDSLLTFLAHEA